MGAEKCVELAKRTNLYQIVASITIRILGFISAHNHPFYTEHIQHHPPVLGHDVATNYPLPFRHKKSTGRSF